MASVPAIVTPPITARGPSLIVIVGRTSAASTPESVSWTSTELTSAQANPRVR